MRGEHVGSAAALPVYRAYISDSEVTSLSATRRRVLPAVLHRDLYTATSLTEEDDVRNPFVADCDT